MFLKVLINELVKERKLLDGLKTGRGVKKIQTGIEEKICFYIAKRYNCLVNHSNGETFDKWVYSYNFELLVQLPDKSNFNF